MVVVVAAVEVVRVVGVVVIAAVVAFSPLFSPSLPFLALFFNATV